MAIYSAVPPPADDAPPAQETPQTPSHQSLAPASATPIDIEAWTVSALQSLSISPVARGTGTPLSIPLEQHHEEQATRRTVTIAVTDVRRDPIRRPPSRRDSLKTRDAVLKGSEGSRQRRRWENDRLVHVPNVQPPLPSDYAPHPTHPVHHIPYHLAAFWDREPSSTAGGNGLSLRQRQAEKLLAQQARRKKLQVAAGAATGLGPGMVPRDLREHARRSPAVRNWVRHLEEPVRAYVRARNEDGARRLAAADVETDVEGLDSEDEEIVFVGRRNQAAAAPAAGPGWKHATRETASGHTEKGVVFDDLGDGDAAAFKRWLTHSISGYYGLQSRSVTAGTPARRVVYVGVTDPDAGTKTRRKQKHTWAELPRPLWEVC